MAMIFGKHGLVGVSRARYKTGVLTPTITDTFRLVGGHGGVSRGRTFYDPSEVESGQPYAVSNDSIVPMSGLSRHSFRLAPRGVTMGYALYSVLHGDAATADPGTPQTRVHEFEGPVTLPSNENLVRAFAMQDIGSPGETDNEKNQLAYNVKGTRAVISAGPTNLSIDWEVALGRSLENIGGAAKSDAEYQDIAPLLPAHWKAFISSDTAEPTPPSDAHFNGTPAEWLSSSGLCIKNLLRSLRIIATDPIDEEGSLASCSVDADGAVIVPVDGYVRGEQGQRLEVEMDLIRDRDDPSGTVGTPELEAWHRAGTEIAFQFDAQNPTAVGGEYDGITLGCLLQPIPPETFTPGMGKKGVTLRWKAVFWGGVAIGGWYCSWQDGSAVEVGG